MATCKDCLHVEVCSKKNLHVAVGMNITPRFKYKRIEQECDHFKDRSRFVELPCHVGDIVTTIDEAIDHCYQIATSTDETVCAECKAEHMRLCGWLGDLKRGIAAKQA